MSQSLTSRQQDALDKIRSQGNTAGIDKGMIAALAKKGFIDGAVVPKVKTAAASVRRGYTDAQQKCLDKIEQAFTIAEEHFGCEFERPVVEFSSKMTRTAGTAKWSWGRHYCVEKPVITLSQTLLDLNGQTFIDDTPGHEAAHIIAVQHYKLHGKGHGRYWKGIMMLIGQQASRCHQMQTAPRKPSKPSKVFTYRATCGTTVDLKSGRHSKIMRGMTYTLRSTGGQINRDGYLG
jgi:SprT protein